MFLYVTAADAVDVVAQSERVNLMSELTFPQTRRCAAVYLIYSHFTASQENCHFDLTFGNFWEQYYSLRKSKIWRLCLLVLVRGDRHRRLELACFSA